MTDTLRIADIQTRQVLYFDPKFRERCYEFCKKRDIDLLPSLDDATQIYVRDDGRADFQTKTVDAARIIEGSRKAFDPAVMGMFRANALLFVYSQDEFSGVVHFSDFNKSVVHTYLFDVIFQYERTLRHFLCRTGLGNADMVSYFEERLATADEDRTRTAYKRKIGHYNKNRAKYKTQPEFQSFYLDDLIGLANAHGLNLNSDVTDVRNMVMHAHELVPMDHQSAGNFIFDIQSFDAFFRCAVVLHHDFAVVRNRVAYMQGLDEGVFFG